MKKIFYFSSALLVALAFAGCNDEEFLKEEPKTIYTVENAFEKSSQVDAQLARVYYQAARMFCWGTSYGEMNSGPATTLNGVGSDTNDSTGQTSSAGSSFSNYSILNTTTGRFNTLWNNLYQLAAYANLTIKGADMVEWADQTAKAYDVAQAMFFKGWAYLRLAECFGGVPIVDEYTESLKFDYARASRQETYQYAIDCFNAAITGLAGKETKNAISESTARHFLTEALIAQGIETGQQSYFTQAVAEADKVIAKHPIMLERFGVRANPKDAGSINGIPNYKEDGNVFYDLFQLGNYNTPANTEALWVIDQPTYDERAANGGIRYTMANNIGQPYRDLMWSDEYKEEQASKGPWAANIDTHLYPMGTTCAYLGGVTWTCLGSNDYIDEFIWRDKYAGGDIRNSQLVLCTPVCLDTKHSLYNKVVEKYMLSEPARHMRISCKIKMQDQWGFDSHHSQYNYQYGRDWYAARSAETYLLKAEAQFRAGNTADAASTLNVLRSRAHADYMLTASDINIYTILDERSRELMWEEHRWPTLLRMGKSGEENVVMHDQIMNHAMYVVEVPTYTSGTPKWSLFPIPETVVQLNTDLPIEQNPGW